MELRDIEYFAVVAEHGNVRRAAEALDLSPPALSMSLRRLEKVMGAKLVMRTPKGVELTPVGTALFAQVGRIRLTLDDVAREAADLSHGRAGLLRVAASPAVGEELPAAYVALSREAPEVKLQVVTADNDVSVPMLLKGEMDVVFNYIPDPPEPGLAHERLYDEIVVVSASAHHRLARRKRVAMADLVEERWAVSSSNLLGYFSRQILRSAGSRLGLKELPVKELVWRRPVGVIYRREGGYLSPAARRFIEILRTTTREIAAEKR